MALLHKAEQRLHTRQELLFVLATFEVKTFSKRFKGKCDFYTVKCKTQYSERFLNICSLILRKCSEKYIRTISFYQSYRLLTTIPLKKSSLATVFHKRSTSSYVLQDLKGGYFTEPKNIEGKKN